MTSQPASIITHDLVLVGAGHAQVAVIKRLVMEPVPGLRCTLISDDRRTPYSGMLPGAIAGFYSEDDLYIDLDRLCATAGVEFIQGRVTKVNPDSKSVHLENGAEITADTLSINPGGAPLSPWEGDGEGDGDAPDWLLMAKPIGKFWQSWTRWKSGVTPTSKPKVLIVGAGAAGVELAFSVDAALSEICTEGARHQITLVGASNIPLPGLGDGAGRSVVKRFEDRGIEYRGGQRVTLDADGPLVDSQRFDADLVIWAAGVAAPSWLTDSGLACDDHGFVQVDATLQSISHRGVFMAGDAVCFDPKPLPKAGVYSVRMGPVLAENLVLASQQMELRKYKPQRNTLFLLGDGQGRAMAWYAGISVWGEWVWRWKDQIDCAFMNRFGRDMQVKHQAMMDSQTQTSGEPMRCGGCAAKVASVGLHSALKGANLSGTSDAAPLVDGWIQSVDAISTPLNDPYRHGYIAVLHALSDLYVSGPLDLDQPPQLAVQVTVQAGRPLNEASRLSLIMQGARDAAKAEGAVIATGHSSSGATDHVCVTVTGKIKPRREAKWDGEPLAVLTTKALGTGVILAARAQGYPVSRGVVQATDQMMTSNRACTEMLWEMGAIAMTDVTGFGLVNHLATILPVNAKARLTLKTLPHLPMALELASAGVRSSAFVGNAIGAGSVPERLSAAESLCFDPQTGGGVAVLVPMRMCNKLPDELCLAGIVAYAKEDGLPPVLLA